MHELPLDRKRLQELAAKARHHNVFPLFLPHYLDGKHPVTPLLVELVAEARELLAALSTDEVKGLVDRLPEFIAWFIKDEMSSATRTARERIAEYFVVAAVQSIYLSFGSVVKEDLDKSEVLKVYPELRDRLDRDGLLPVADDVVLHDGGVHYRDHMLHYHQLLRRGYTSNPNYDFLARLVLYHRRTSGANTFRVAIDHRRIMLKEWYARIIEADRWYGPPFDPSRLDDPSAVGLTVIHRNDDPRFSLVNRLEHTEFLWTRRASIKTFQVEGVSSPEYRFEGYHFNRYVHSERDIQAKVTHHLDGAVKVYHVGGYQDRLSTKLPKEAKCARRIKLWRIDGDIDLENWVDLICFFYKSNEMLIEYFNPAEFERMFASDIKTEDSQE